MKTTILGLMLLTFAACSSGTSSSPNTPDKNNRNEKLANYLISVKSQDGMPVASAQILLGVEYLEKRFFTANENGLVEIPKSIWTEKMAITVGAENYIRASYLAMEPGSYELSINSLRKERNFGVRGETKGFGSLKKDGWADFSLVAPTFSRQQLIGFELSYVISDQMDTMSVYGQEISIPSNISFPRQKENYGFFPVTLDKPSYRMPFYFPGTYQLAAIHGRFPFKEVVGKLRDGKSVIEVVNDFEFKQTGLSLMEISGPDHAQDLEINHIEFNQATEIQAPNYASSDILLIIALNQNDRGFFPSGLRRLNSGEVASLKFAPNFEHHILAVLTQENESGGITDISNKMSIQVAALNASNNIQLLDHVESPQWNGNSLSLFPPAKKVGVNEGGTYLSLTAIESKENPHLQMDETRKKWEIYAEKWVEGVQLPQWPTGLSQDTKLRWEVMFLGKTTNEKSPVGPGLIRKASHVSRNTVEL